MKTLALSFGFFVPGAEAKATAKLEFDHAVHSSNHALFAARDGPIQGKSAATCWYILYFTSGGHIDGLQCFTTSKCQVQRLKNIEEDQYSLLEVSATVPERVAGLEDVSSPIRQDSAFGNAVNL